MSSEAVNKLSNLSPELIKQSVFLLVVYAGSAFVIASGVDYVLKNVLLKDEYVALNPSQRDLLRLVT